MRRKLLAFVLLLMLLTASAAAEGVISANVHVRASRTVYDSVIRVGEDVDMTVDIAGFVPAACQWYREGMMIECENLPTLHIDSAEVADSGIYRMDALDSDGRVRLSVDVALRVVDYAIPQTGDSRIPAPTLIGAIAAAFAVLAAAVGRKVAKIQQKHT